ncbi:Fc.00g082890.m01.CDS01 [Cosmosporella sp. VM-42]
MASKKEFSEGFQKGLDVRGEVLGEEYVTRAVGMLDDEYWAPVQEWITESGWGAVWTRPGLERKQRSLLNLGFLTALKSWPELALHTKGALRNGLTEVEIREAIFQSMLYCGVPAGVEAMRVTSKAIKEYRESQGQQEGSPSTALS